MRLRKDQRGFGAIHILLLIIIVALIGFTGWFVWHAKQNSDRALDSNTSTTPVVKKQTSKNVPATEDTYAGWKTYDNQKYGVSFKYPETWAVEESSSDSTSGLDPIEFAVSIDFSTNDKYKAAAGFEVHTHNLETVNDTEDEYFGQSQGNHVTKNTTTIQGRDAVIFSVLNNSIPTKVYLVNAGDKTYSFSSYNEELNQQRSSDYWSNFNKVYNSLVINQ